MQKIKKVVALCLSVALMGAFTGCNKDDAIDNIPEMTDIATMPTLEIMTMPSETEVPAIKTEINSESSLTSVVETEVSESETSESETSTSETSTSETTISSETSIITVESSESSAVTNASTKLETTITEKTPVETTVTTAEAITVTPMEDIINVSKNKGKSLIYNQLTEEEQDVYNAILKAVLGFKSTVKFEEKLTEEEYHRLFCIVFYQNPELFWWQGTLMLADDGMSATLAYTYSQEQASSYQKYIDKKVAKLLSKLTTDMSDLQKVIICHNWLCVNNVFSKETENSKNIYGSIANGVAQCEGYSKGMLYLMNKIGVPCILSTGSNSNGLSHAWVKVQINGEWTNIDPTFDDSVMDEPVDYTNVSYRYMGVPDVAIYGYTHFDANTSPVDHSIKLFETPECTTYSLNADINYGNYADTYEQAFEILKSECFEAVEQNKRCAHVKISNNEEYLRTLNQLVQEKHIFDIRKAINDKYGEGTVKAFAVSPENKLNYVEVTMYYGDSE